MADSIDRLSIEINASANQATQSINTLIGKLNSLQQTLNTTNAKKLNKELTKTSQLIKTFGNSSKNSTNQVSNSFRNSSYAIQNMANGLNRINNRVNTFFSNMRKGAKETENFAQKVGLLYARFFLLIRGIRLLGTAIKSSMDYIETLNYFDSVFNEIGEGSIETMRSAGEDAGDAYVEGFKEHAKTVIEDMTGFTPETNGMLTATGRNSLGLNVNDVMKYQTQYAQFAKSMGIAGDKATILSDALVKIGADLASVKNEDFTTTWTRMSSVLAGMTRTAREYGVDISVAGMNTKLAQLGIDATASSLSQADKALLRTIILLDSSKYAWGDLAETINTPANQIRIFTANLQQLGRMIGNLFLPIIAKVLPYLNAFVIVLQRLVSWIAKIFHIDLSGLTSGKGSNGIGDLADDASDLEDNLDDATGSAKKLKHQLQGFDELNNLTTNDDSGSKLKGLGAGGLLDDAFMDAIDDYLKAWQDALDKLQNRAQEIADKIQEFFLRLLAPLIKAWTKYGDWVIEKWKKAFKSIGELFKTVGDDFWSAWESDETVAIFENLVQILGQIGLLIGTIADKIRIAWSENDNGYKILCAIRDIIGIIVQHIKNASDATVLWAQELDLVPLFDSVATFLTDIQPAVDAVYGILETFYTDVLLPLGKWTLEKGLPSLVKVFDDLAKRIDWSKIQAQFEKLWEHLEPFGERVGEGLILFIEDISTKLGDWVESGGFERFMDSIGRFLDSISAKDVKHLFWAITNGIIALKLAVLGFNGAKGLDSILGFFRNSETISAIGTTLGSLMGEGGIAGLATSLAPYIAIFAGLAITFYDLYNNCDNFKQSVLDAKAQINGAFSGLGDSVAEVKQSIDGLFNSLYRLYQESGLQELLGIIGSLIAQELGEQISSSINVIASTLSGFAQELSGVIDIATGLIEVLNGIKNFDFEMIKQGFADMGKGIKEEVDGAFTMIQGWLAWLNPAWDGALSDTVKTVDDKFAEIGEIIQGWLDVIGGFFEELSTKFGDLKSGAQNWFNNLTGNNTRNSGNSGGGSYRMFANGGFPEDGLFFANHNELVGQFSNGKTAVANNDQIVAGIEQGVYNAVVSAMATSSGSTNVNVTLQGDADGIFKVVRNSAKTYQKANGIGAFSF